MNTSLAHFTRFSSLPVEIRAMIWLETYSEPRVMEIVSYKPNLAHASITYAFRMCFQESTLWTDLHTLSQRSLDDETQIKAASDPISLRVCQESRATALDIFSAMHYEDSKYKVFFHPQIDSLWLSNEIMESLSILKKLDQAWLSQIQKAIIGEYHWIIMDESPGALGAVTNLHTVVVALDIYRRNDDWEVQGSTTEEHYPIIAQTFAESNRRTFQGHKWCIEYMGPGNVIYDRCVLK